MRDYTKGKIYKIVSPNCDKIYIGSTITSLRKRFISGHKCDDRTYTSSKEIIDAGDAYIELIEEYSCNSLKELLWRERTYYDYYKNIYGEKLVNKLKPTSSWEEKMEDTYKIIKWDRSWGDSRYHNCLLRIKI